MKTFDVVRIGGALYLIVQADHLLTLNTVVLVPVLPAADLPVLSRLTVDVMINGAPYRIRAHMPLTVEAHRVKQKVPVYRLTAEEGQAVMDGLNTILWGL